MSSFDRATLWQLLEQVGIKKLHHTGNGISGQCPMHDNRTGTSWGINLDGLWRCFNPSCPGFEGGNLTMFLVQVVGMPLRDAVAFQPARAVTEEMVHRRLPPYENRQVVEDVAEDTLPEARLNLYRMCPNYMVQRGYPPWFLASYDVGYDGKAHWPDKAVREAVTFPVRDHVGGKLLGFTRRAVEPGVDPVYSHDVAKNRTLYLLHRLSPGPVLITEGPCDALTARLRAHEEDGPLEVVRALANAVATMGGGFSIAHAKMLAQIGRPVVLAFDNDDAGMQARERAVHLLHAASVVAIQVMLFPGKDLGDLLDTQVSSVRLVSSYHRFGGRGAI